MSNPEASLPKTPADTAPLREQLVQAAAAFATREHPLAELLQRMADDVERASAEKLEIFPVCHHSPASGLHAAKRLREKKFRVLFVELCEDLRVQVPNLVGCQFPVALQGFSQGSEAFPAEWTPLNIVAPLSEFSAEYQAIAYAMANPDVELVFVDRAVDYVFQWTPKTPGALEAKMAQPEEGEESGGNAPGAASGPTPPTASHGGAVGVGIGNLIPTFEEFTQFLLRNARVQSFTEWWEQYVEGAVLGGDYATYRHVLFLVGSLIRRLGRKNSDQREDRDRERYMWTRMKEWLAANKVKPEDALYICGAAHSASEVPEWGTHTDARWDVPKLTETKWLYGLVPSSYLAIERQFGHPPGTMRMAESAWKKAQDALGVKPFAIPKKLVEKSGSETSEETPKKAAKGKKPAKPVAGDAPSEEPVVDLAKHVPVIAGPAGSVSLVQLLTRPPVLRALDDEELLAWSVEITAKARDNGYLTSTADSIAIYQTSTLLAGLRGRQHPSAYDFIDAAVTCIEKDRTPKKRNVRRLCEIMLGGDRLGRVGYSSLPPLAQDVYRRLAPLPVKLDSTHVERALMDFKQHPEWLPCSDVLWMLKYLAPGLVKPIMGERTLGSKPVQESWELYVGRAQGTLIQLGYEGVSIEHVLERRLKTSAFAADARTSTVLDAVESAAMYLKSPRLLNELGERAVLLLEQETGGAEAPEVFERVRRLVSYFRTTPGGLPGWLRRFVTTGYSHYASLLPVAFAENTTNPKQLAAMLNFLFTLESLALSFGCQRSEFLIGVKQASRVTEDPQKLGLLWTAEWVLGLRPVSEIRGYLDRVLSNQAMLGTFPQYVTGFLLALGFTPLVGRLVVELLSKSFARLPDRVLFPWLPTLLLTLRPHGDLVQTLLREAALLVPKRFEDLATWVAPWEQPEEVSEESAEGESTEGALSAEGATAEARPTASASSVQLAPAESAVRAMLGEHRVATEALAELLGVKGGAWTEPTAKAEQATEASAKASVGAVSEGAVAKPVAAKPAGGAAKGADPAVAALLRAYPVATEALAALLGDG